MASGNKKLILLDIDKYVCDYRYLGEDVYNGNNISINLAVNGELADKRDQILIDKFGLNKENYIKAVKILEGPEINFFLNKTVIEGDNPTDSIVLLKGEPEQFFFSHHFSDTLEYRINLIKEIHNKQDSEGDYLVDVFGLASGPSSMCLYYDVTYYFSVNLKAGGIDGWRKFIKSNYNKGTDVIVYSKRGPGFLHSLAKKLGMNRILALGENDSDKMNNWCTKAIDYTSYAYGDPQCAYPNLISFNNYEENNISKIVKMFTRLGFTVTSENGRNLFVENIINEINNEINERKGRE